MNVRRRFLLLAVALYAVGAAVVIESPWHDHRSAERASVASAPRVDASRASQVQPSVVAHTSAAPLPVLPVVTVRPDDNKSMARTARGRTAAPLLDVARATTGSLLPSGALRMPYYSFGKTVHRETRE